MGQDAVQRARHLIVAERLDEQSRIPDLPPPAAAQEAPELLVDGPLHPRRLLLQRAKRPKITLRGDDLEDRGRSESADQLVLEVLVADEEAEPFQIRAREVGAEPGALETAFELALLAGVAEPGQPKPGPARTEPLQEPPDRLGSADRYDRDGLRLEVPAAALGERFECDAVAGPLHEHQRTGPASGVRAVDYDAVDSSSRATATSAASPSFSTTV